MVFVPGTTGTVLREAETRRVQWGNGRSLFTPRDGGRALAVPIDPVAGRGTPLELAGPVLEIRIGPYRKQAYGPLVKFMLQAGYVAGDLADPNPGENFYFYSYDWRRSNVDNARELAHRLDELRCVNHLETLRIQLVAQSSGAHLARYFIKYAGAPLDEAEQGAARRLASIEVDKLILVGTSNGGALRILRDMHRGRRYLPFGRLFGPEVLFTFRSLFEDLPVFSDGLFVDEAGLAAEIDLFDAENWRLYQWSIYEPRVAARLARMKGNHPFGDESSRSTYLSTRLRDAGRFHRLLRKDVPWFGKTRYYSLQSISERTPARALVVERGGRRRIGFSGDREVDGNSRLALRAAATGDGHATRESQEWLSPQERSAFAHDPVYFEGRHFGIILDRGLQMRLLEFLRDETPAVLIHSRSDGTASYPGIY